MNSKYQNGKIYCIWSYETDEIYIGSTCRTLKRRLQSHKSSYRGFLKKTKHSHYTSSYEILKYDNVEIGIIEEYPCNNKEELYRREGELQQQIKCVNKLIAGRTQKEWRILHRQELLDYGKKYRVEHKEELQKKRKIYVKKNENLMKEKRKEKYRENKNDMNKKSREYQKKNIEQINKNRGVKFDCQCGGHYTLRHKARHLKTKQHIKWLEENKKLITDNIEDGEEKKE